MLRPTVHGKGPFTPVVIYNERLFVLGQPMEDMEEALAHGSTAATPVRARALATLSWIMSLALLPVAGLVIYHFLGPTRIRRQRQRRAGQVRQRVGGRRQRDRDQAESRQGRRPRDPPAQAHGSLST